MIAVGASDEIANHARVLLIVASPHDRDTRAEANPLAAVQPASSHQACPLLNLHPAVCFVVDRIRRLPLHIRARRRTSNAPVSFPRTLYAAVRSSSSETGLSLPPPSRQSFP